MYCTIVLLPLAEREHYYFTLHHLASIICVNHSPALRTPYGDLRFGNEQGLAKLQVTFITTKFAITRYKTA
jgi:hypothetical protein